MHTWNKRSWEYIILWKIPIAIWINRYRYQSVINTAVSTISRDWWVDINLAVVSLWFNFSLRTSAKIWVRPLHRKLCVNIASENNISPIFPDTPTGVLGRSLWVWHDIADVIEHGKFCFKRFRSFGDLTPQIPILHRLPYIALRDRDNAYITCNISSGFRQR